jgi:hypothetical protein
MSSSISVMVPSPLPLPLSKPALPSVFWGNYCNYIARNWLDNRDATLLTGRDKMFEAFVTFIMVPFACLNGLEVSSELITSVVSFGIAAEIGLFMFGGIIVPAAYNVPLNPNARFHTWCDFLISKMNDSNTSYRSSISGDFYHYEILGGIANFSGMYNLSVGSGMYLLLVNDGSDSDCESSNESTCASESVGSNS